MGGNPVIAGDTVLLNDALGSSMGSTDGQNFTAISGAEFGRNIDEQCSSGI